MLKLILRFLERIADGPLCPDCGDSAYVHLDDRCLVIRYDRPDVDGVYQQCECTTPYGASKRAERRHRRQMALVP